MLERLIYSWQGTFAVGELRAGVGRLGCGFGMGCVAKDGEVWLQFLE